MTDIKLLGAAGDYRGLYLILIEEWAQFIRRDNWHTFHPILVEFEGDWILGGVEVSIVILGLGFRLRWNYERTEKIDEIDRRVDEVLKNGFEEMLKK